MKLIFRKSKENCSLQKWKIFLIFYFFQNRDTLRYTNYQHSKYIFKILLNSKKLLLTLQIEYLQQTK